MSTGELSLDSPYIGQGSASLPGWVQEKGSPDPLWEEWHLTAEDESYQLRVCTGHDGHYMMIKLDADGTRHNYGHSKADTIKGAQCECLACFHDTTLRSRCKCSQKSDR